MLRVKYWRCMDKKLWDELGDCFAGDVTVDYPNVKCKGRKALVQVIRENLGHGTTSIHHGHNPEIEVTGNTAKGIWTLYAYITDAQANTARKSLGSYEDEYAQEGGGVEDKIYNIYHHL